MLQRAQEACPRARIDVTENVFGYDPMTTSKLKVTRKQEESTAVQELMVNMEQRFNNKRAETNKVLAAAPGSLSLCDLPAAKRRKLEMNIRRDKRS